MELWPTINQKITLKGIKSDGKTIYNVTKDLCFFFIELCNHQIILNSDVLS